MTLLQPLLFPQPKKNNPNPAAQNQAAKTDDTTSAAQDGEATPEKPAAQTAVDANPQTAKNAAQDQAANAAAEYPDKAPQRLIALGAFGPENPDKFLVTLNSKGASIRRIELNARFPNGKLRYYDQETRGAYMGFLELTKEPRGCEIHFVGPGTPAAVAGLQVGDVITAINDKPVMSPRDVSDVVDSSKPGSELRIAYDRGSESAINHSTCNVKLVQKPLEVIGSEIADDHEDNAAIPESYLVTLRKKTHALWPEIDERLNQVNWNAEEKIVDGTKVVEFSHEIPAGVLSQHDLAGPLKMIKRFWLPKPTKLDDLEKNFHVHLEIEIQNLANKPAAVALEIDGPTGTNIEGWWYQSKIHGRASAIGYVAGARDVVAGSAQDGFVFYGNGEIIKNYMQRDPETQAVISQRGTPNPMYFIAVDTLYFVAALVPDTIQSRVEQATALPTFSPYSGLVRVIRVPADAKSKARLQRMSDVSFRLFTDEIVLPAADPQSPGANAFRTSFLVFAGPKEPQLLQKYAVGPRNNLSEVITFGWFAPFSKPLLWLLRFFYSIFKNYGIAIVCLTVIVRTLMMPISRRIAMNAQQTSKMMQQMQPDLKRVNERHKDDLEKRMRATQEVYAKHGFNPLKQQFGGCLPAFLQLPIFIGLYRGLSVDVALRGQPLIPGIEWCSDLAAPDQMLYWKNWMPSILGSETGWFGPYLNLLPLVTIALFLVQTKLFMPPPTDEQQRTAQRMMTFMMIFMSVLFFKVPSGLCLYLITSSIWGMIERATLPKTKTDSSAQTDEGTSAASAPRTPQRVGQR